MTAHLSRGLQALIAEHTFVGVVDRRFVLLQHLTKLYVVHMGVASEAFFYQQVLRRWGNLSTIRLQTPVAVEDLYLLGAALSHTGGARDAGGDSEEAEAEDKAGANAGGVASSLAIRPRASGDVVPTMPFVRFDAPPSRAARRAAAEAAALLDSKAEMLLEYLSLEIFEGELCALPQLVDGYVPPLNGLPTFICRLVHDVDWTAEQPCFDGLAKQLAALYRVDHVGRASAAPGASADGGADGRDGHAEERRGDEGADPAGRTEEACSAAWAIQHVLLPAMRRTYEPPTAHCSNGAVVQVACTEQLYKIFERC